MSRWLALAAAPTFAVMALWTLAAGEGAMICTATPSSPLNGMALMYGLMAVFHLGPWLRSSSSPVQRSGAGEGDREAVEGASGGQ